MNGGAEQLRRPAAVDVFAGETVSAATIKTGGYVASGGEVSEATISGSEAGALR